MSRKRFEGNQLISALVAAVTPALTLTGVIATWRRQPWRKELPPAQRGGTALMQLPSEADDERRMRMAARVARDVGVVARVLKDGTIEFGSFQSSLREVQLEPVDAGHELQVAASDRLAALPSPSEMTSGHPDSLLRVARIREKCASRIVSPAAAQELLSSSTDAIAVDLGERASVAWSTLHPLPNDLAKC
jgi:hypothetical protein